MSRRSPTARIAASETQPSCCSWTRHRIAIAADAWRPGGYLAISFLAQARFSSENEKLAGCNSFGASRDRKSTRLNSSHTVISYAVFCLKKKKKKKQKII